MHHHLWTLSFIVSASSLSFSFTFFSHTWVVYPLYYSRASSSFSSSPLSRSISLSVFHVRLKTRLSHKSYPSKTECWFPHDCLQGLKTVSDFSTSCSVGFCFSYFFIIVVVILVSDMLRISFWATLTFLLIDWLIDLFIYLFIVIGLSQRQDTIQWY